MYIKTSIISKYVSDKAITYTDKFKRHFFAENERGQLTRDIFEAAGLSEELISLDRIKTAGKRWRAAYP